MATLYLLNFNNYYNRQVKRFDTLEEYLAIEGALLGDPIEGVNFIPRDYINTQQIVNWDGDNPNYLLVVDDDGNIKSRWFVISTSRVLEGQLALDLYRDTVAEYYDEVVNAPMFIEKGTPQNINDPAVFNSEDMTFNQIKSDEVLLKDKTGIPWIVGYIPRDSYETAKEVKVNMNYSGSQAITVDELTDWENYQYSQQPFMGEVKDILYTAFVRGGHQLKNVLGFNTDYYSSFYKVYINSNGDYTVPSGYTLKGNVGPNDGLEYKFRLSPETHATEAGVGVNGEDMAVLASLFQNYKAHINEINNALIGDVPGATAGFETLLAFDGSIIHTTKDNQYYRIKVNKVTKEESTSVESGGLYNVMRQYVSYTNYDALYAPPSTGNNPGYFGVTFLQPQYTYIFEPLASAEVYTNIQAKDARYHLADSPYDMFCIPFPNADDIFTVKNGSTTILSQVDRDAGFALSTSIAAQTGSGNQYDVQLLPFCPIKSIVQDGAIDLSSMSYQDIRVRSPGSTETGALRSVLIFCTTSEFQVDIDFDIPAGNSIEEVKVLNETEKWRLCSPNYSGLFEFSPQMNNGVTTFQADCNYKPFSPYIHVAPVFNQGSLYGNDYNDARGLVCGGDYSLPAVTSAWADYQLSNKNYQQMFDRQIQNMEVNNAVQREKEAWAIAANTMGAFTDSFTSGNALPTSLMQGGISLIAGLRDRQLNDKLRNEGIDYTKDQFGYQLGNIQALPQGLAKVSAFTANNKIFPFLEKYTCTSTETTALKNKLKYNGYTIMRIGTISEFSPLDGDTYVKGQLIRFPNSIQENFDITNRIAAELYKGVFI